jgi:lysozyme
MNVNAEGFALIKRFEGFEATPYEDAGNRPVIGFGHLIRPGETFTTITKEQAEQLLLDDLADDEKAVTGMVSVPLNDNQFSALVSWVYNLGAGRFRGSDLRAFVNRKAWQLAADEFAKWVWSTLPDGKKAKLPGLVERRAAERALFMKPVIVADNGVVAV